MRNLATAAVLVLILCILHVLALNRAAAERKEIAQNETVLYVLPSPVLKISALEFDGLASDFMFLRSLTFIGTTLERKGHQKKITPAEWKWLLDSFSATTDLDPYFLDPYYVAEAQLTWEAFMISETNTLLAKGMKYRDWDWIPPFFIGFNNFYFLQDHGEASKYLMEASRRHDANPLLARLATRLAVKAQQTENAILFLEELLKQTEEEATRKQFAMRLSALRTILALEQSVKKYESLNNKSPKNIQALVDSGIIRDIPADPYGGEFYLESDGSIKTTSNMFTVYSRKRSY